MVSNLHDQMGSRIARGKRIEPGQLRVATLRLPWRQDLELSQGHTQERNSNDHSAKQ